MRQLFLTIPLSESWQQSIQDWIHLQPNYFPWIVSEKRHITVQYLGSISDEDIPAMVEELQSVYCRIPSFFLTLFSVCPFPSTNPRMIWAKVKQSPSFSNLVTFSRQTTNLYVLERPEEGVPLPHITLSRLGGQYDLTDLSFPTSRMRSPMMHVKRVELWETVRTQRGKQYEVLNSFYLEAT